MAINYIIQADVVDITADSPQASDVFLVDTNVWYWVTYTRASQSSRPPRAYQTNHYPIYLNSALGTGARIHQCGLSLAELSHRIEKVEQEIYEKASGALRSKEYRHNLPSERARVVSEVQAAWGQVKSLADPLSVTIDEPTTNAALVLFQGEKLDGYDLFILEAMRTHSVIQVITDDGDFATVPSIQVFTANKTVIKTARTQDKLLSR